MTPGIQHTENDCWDRFWTVIALAAVERQERWDRAAEDEATPLQEAA
ncbi:hypothetical protein [Streptomyces sp. NPDC091027]